MLDEYSTATLNGMTSGFSFFLFRFKLSEALLLFSHLLMSSSFWLPKTEFSIFACRSTDTYFTKIHNFQNRPRPTLTQYRPLHPHPHSPTSPVDVPMNLNSCTFNLRQDPLASTANINNKTKLFQAIPFSTPSKNKTRWKWCRRTNNKRRRPVPAAC